MGAASREPGFGSIGTSVLGQVGIGDSDSGQESPEGGQEPGCEPRLSQGAPFAPVRGLDGAVFGGRHVPPPWSPESSDAWGVPRGRGVRDGLLWLQIWGRANPNTVSRPACSGRRPPLPARPGPVAGFPGFLRIPRALCSVLGVEEPCKESTGLLETAEGILFLEKRVGSDDCARFHQGLRASKAFGFD